MKSKIFLQLITLISAFFIFIRPSFAVAIAENEAIIWTNQTGYKLIEALGNPNLEAKYAVLDEMFTQDVDTTYLARFVLGKYWKNMDEAQKKTYVGLFKRYVLSLYKSYPLNFDVSGLNFTVTSAKTVGNYTNIICNIKLPESIANENLQSLNLEFKLTKNDGKIQIIDLKIGESSLLLTYRNRFYTMIKDVDEDMSWFLEDLTDLTLSNEKNVQKNLNNF